MKNILDINPVLFLTEYEEADAAALVKYLNDPEIARNTSTIPYPYTDADAVWWLQRIEDTRRTHGQVNSWAIRHRDLGLAGGIGVFFHSGPNGHFDEIGYWLAEPFRGKGYMTEIVKAFTAWQFAERTNLVRLEAWVYAHNPASQRVLEKAGFQREGYARKRALKNGNALDLVFYGLLSE